MIRRLGHVRSLRRRARRPARRGEPRHVEFYRARAAITRRLIEDHGFTIVAVEADWPDAATIDRYVRHRPKREGELTRVRALPDMDVAQPRVRRLHPLDAPAQRATAPYEGMCGFYGLDLYNLCGSMQAVIDFLEREDPELARLAHRRYGCLEPWAEEPQPMAATRCSRAMPGARSASSRCSRTCCRSRSIARARMRRMARRGGQCAAREERRGILSGHVPRLRGELESCATRTCSTR